MGKKAPRIILADTSEQNWVDFYQLPQKYNLLIFGILIVVIVKNKYQTAKAIHRA